MVEKHACEICGRPEAKHTCKLCGRKVCEEHYIKEKQICTICNQTLCQICGEKLAIGFCIVCGRLGCNDCLIQIDNVRRICRDCLRKQNKPPTLKIPRGPIQLTLKILGNQRK